jgi:glycosyltransferase involved in cell wall biosynthesis
MNNISPTELYLIGPVINSLSSNELLIKVNKNDNVFYEGVLNQEVAFDLVKNCDYGLILLEDVADYSDTSPNKLFEYMMLSTPFIATDFTKWKALLSGISAGFFISPEGIDFNFANKLINTRNDQKSYQDMSKSGIDFVYHKYNWVISDEPQLLKLYKRVLDK